MTAINIGSTERGAQATLELRYLNRHLLVTGATGSGKSVSVMRVCEESARQGVPVLAFDAKGDLAGLALSAAGAPRFARLFDAFGDMGERVALSFQAMGADATSRALGLSYAQSGAVDVAFAMARQERLPLASPSDLSAALARVGFAHHRGIHVSKVSMGVISRALLRVDPEAFKGAAFDPLGCLETRDGAGRIAIFDAQRLADSGPLYGAAICQTLESLYGRLPEVGDAARPRLLLVIDEAHLLFADIEPQLLQRVERIVRLIRSKGVALIFASQSPADIPPLIAAQCASRIQHALRAVTPQDARAVQVAADSLVGAGPEAARQIGSLKPGEAFVSLVGADGAPSQCARVQVARPSCRLGALSTDERRAIAPAPATGGAGEARGLSAQNGSDLAQIAVVIGGFILLGALTAKALGGFREFCYVTGFTLAIYVLRRPLLLLLWIVGIHGHHGHHGHGRHRH